MPKRKSTSRKSSPKRRVARKPAQQSDDEFGGFGNIYGGSF